MNYFSCDTQAMNFVELLVHLRSYYNSMNVNAILQELAVILKHPSQYLEIIFTFRV